jgi:hypothetical protein
MGPGLLRKAVVINGRADAAIKCRPYPESIADIFAHRPVKSSDHDVLIVPLLSGLV